jgi:hypothetical protein
MSDKVYTKTYKILLIEFKQAFEFLYERIQGHSWGCPICGAEDDCKQDCEWDNICAVYNEIVLRLKK